MKRTILGFSLLLTALLFSLPALSAQGKIASIDAKTAKILYNSGSNRIAGNPEGSITLVELFDYNCGYCRKLQPVLNDLIINNPDLRVVYKEFLLFGDSSLIATKAALAAQLQDKYLVLHDALLNAVRPLTEDEVMRIAQAQGIDITKLKIDMGHSAIIKQINDNNALLAKMGIDGAPIVIVTHSDIAKFPEKHLKQPQYIRMGFDNAPQDIQAMIDKVKQGQ